MSPGGESVVVSTEESRAPGETRRVKGRRSLCRVYGGQKTGGGRGLFRVWFPPAPNPRETDQHRGYELRFKIRPTLIHILPLSAQWLSELCPLSWQRVPVRIKLGNRVTDHTSPPGTARIPWTAASTISVIDVVPASGETPEFWGGLGSQPGKKDASQEHISACRRAPKGTI